MLALTACSNEEIFAPETPQPGSGAIELTVSAGDFVTDGAPLTRAADNGNVTTFDRGDRIGLIVLKDNGTDLVADNLPYKYDGASWAFDAGNGESKTAPYYDNGISDVTYIAYFPYSKEADNVKTPDELKSKFTPKTNQRSEADYRASDLMVWTSGAASVPQKKLDIALTHAYASISLSPELKCTLNDGDNTSVSLSSSRLSDINITVGSDIYLPFQSEDGSFRCILPAGTSGTVRWFYTFGGETYGSSRDLSGGTTANTRYVQQETLNAGEYSLDMAQAGDFYCKNGSGEGYLIPGEVASLPSEQKSACIGIVYWMGDITGEDPLLKRDKPDCTHGLVMALQDASTSNSLWSSSYEDITNEWLSKQSGNPYIITTLKTTDKMQGYANTAALKGYNKAKGDGSNLRALPIDLIGTYVTNHPAPASSSDWYLPSVKELKYMCWGQNNSSGVAGKKMLDAQLGKLEIASLRSYYYWSSTERDSNWAWGVDFSDGSVDNDGNKGSYSFGVRAVVAFECAVSTPSWS